MDDFGEVRRGLVHEYGEAIVWRLLDALPGCTDEELANALKRDRELRDKDRRNSA